MESDGRTSITLLTARAVAERLGVSVRTLRRWARAGRVPVVQVGGPGGRVMVPVQWLESLIRTAVDGAAPRPGRR